MTLVRVMGNGEFLAASLRSASDVRLETLRRSLDLVRTDLRS